MGAVLPRSPAAAGRGGARAVVRGEARAGHPADAAVTRLGRPHPRTNKRRTLGAGDAGRRRGGVDANGGGGRGHGREGVGARNQYARWQAALDDGVADVSSPQTARASARARFTRRSPSDCSRCSPTSRGSWATRATRRRRSCCGTSSRPRRTRSTRRRLSATATTRHVLVRRRRDDRRRENGPGAHDGDAGALMDVARRGDGAVGLSPEEASAEIVRGGSGRTSRASEL